MWQGHGGDSGCAATQYLDADESNGQGSGNRKAETALGVVPWPSEEAHLVMTTKQVRKRLAAKVANG